MKMMNCLGLACALTCFGFTALESFAQNERVELLQSPQSSQEVWNAVKFSINVGKPEQAGQYLDQLIGSNPAPDFLIEMREKDGTKYFPRLRNHRELSEKVTALVRMADAAAVAKATNPDRIRKFIGYLSMSSEHRKYGLQQLRLAGPVAIPHLVRALQSPVDDEQRNRLIYGLQNLDSAAVPPLVAALRTSNPDLRIRILQALTAYRDSRIISPLRYLADSPNTTPTEKAFARRAVELNTESRYDDLPAASRTITNDASLYYSHKADLRARADGTVEIWSIAGGELTSQVVSAAYGEEIHCLDLTQLALALNPNYEPAQTLMISMMLERDQLRVGLDKDLPVGGTTGTAAALRCGPEAIARVLSKALQENRSTTALAALRALKHLSDRSQVGAQSSLLLAVGNKDLRVQFAAVDAILAMKPQQAVPGSSSAMAVLSRAVHPDAQSRPKAMVIDHRPARGSALAGLFRNAGYATEYAADFVEAMSLLDQSLAYEFISVHPNLQNPEVSYALASLRSNPRIASIPIILPGEQSMMGKLKKYELRYPGVKSVLYPETDELLQRQISFIKQDEKTVPLSAEERADYAKRAVIWLVKIARGEIPGFSARTAEKALSGVATHESLGAGAIEALGYLSTPTSQATLAETAAAATNPENLRTLAAQALAGSIRRSANFLKQGEVASLGDALITAKNVALQHQLSAVVGLTLTGDANSAQQLLKYAPPAYDPAAGAQPPGQN